MTDTASALPPLNPERHHLLGSDAPPEPRRNPIRDESAVALSGGGFRAMLFHLGFLWRMRDAGLLNTISRFSSVSGGSITAGALALAWNQIDWDDDGQSFRKLVADPLMELSRHTIDIAGGIIGLVPGLSGNWVRRAYDKYVFGGAKLADVPKSPCFVFNATSIHTGKLMRFTGEWFSEWSTGRWENADLSLSTAVAASSAFPPVLAPVVINLAGHAPIPLEGTLHQPPEKLFLVDGGVYDNLGIEAVWKRFRTVYVSDAGAAFAYDPGGLRFMPGLAYRVTGIMMEQIGSLRFRQMLGGYDADAGTAERREGFLVSSEYFVEPRPAGGPPYSMAHARQLAATPTRLCAFAPALSHGLVNWGYLACDDRLRARGSAGDRCQLPFTKYPVS